MRKRLVTISAIVMIAALTACSKSTDTAPTTESAKVYSITYDWETVTFK